MNKRQDHDENTEPLANFAQTLAKAIGDRWPQFGGVDLRADAGEPGMIYVALRGARRQPELGEKLAEKIENLAAELSERGEAAIAVAISLGRGNKDLLLQIECRLAQR